MYRIFISYRRGDTAGSARQLFEDLESAYGRKKVFYDEREISAGEPFPEVLKQTVREAWVVLVLVGERWAEITDDAGRRRLEDPEDWVAREVRLALEDPGRVVPILLQKIPVPSDVPDDLAPLLELQAEDLTTKHWARDVKAIRKAIDARYRRKVGRTPWRWTFPAAAGALLVGALCWLTDALAAVPWGDLETSFDRAIASQVPAEFHDDMVGILRLEDSESESPDERRKGYATKLGELVDKEARTVVFDVYFNDEDTDPTETDEDLAASIRAARDKKKVGVVFGRLAPEASEGTPRPIYDAISDAWGLVDLYRSTAERDTLPLVELARLRGDRMRDVSVWPSIAVRGVMEHLRAPRIRWDPDAGELLLLPEESSEPALMIPVVWYRKGGHDLLLAYIHLPQASEFEDVEASRADKIVVVGSAREKPVGEFGPLLGYQVHAQIISQILSVLEPGAPPFVRPAGVLSSLAGLALVSILGVAWRRRARRPLAISEPRSPYSHWGLSLVDLSVGALFLAVPLYLTALVAFRAERLLLPVPYLLLAFVLANLLLAWIERRRAA